MQKSLTYKNIKYTHFCLYHQKWDTNSIFEENDSENLKKLESILIFLSFLIKISCQSKESPFL